MVGEAAICETASEARRRARWLGGRAGIASACARRPRRRSESPGGRRAPRRGSDPATRRRRRRDRAPRPSPSSLELGLALDPIEIGVNQRHPPRVLVDQREGRAGDVALGRHLQAARHPLHERRLAGAQRADERHHVARAERRRPGARRSPGSRRRSPRSGPSGVVIRGAPHPGPLPAGRRSRGQHDAFSPVGRGVTA